MSEVVASDGTTAAHYEYASFGVVNVTKCTVTLYRDPVDTDGVMRDIEDMNDEDRYIPLIGCLVGLFY